jgi:hypothetical protein
MVPDIRSPIAKSAIDTEFSKVIINGILDIFRDISRQINYPTMYYYYIDVNEIPLAYSFEEKSSIQLICLSTNIGVEMASATLFLLAMVHNGHFEFFNSRKDIRDSVSWLEWILKFIEKEQKINDNWTKTIVVDTILSPGKLVRRKKCVSLSKENVEIYTLDTFWDIIHSRDYKKGQ